MHLKRVEIFVRQAKKMKESLVDCEAFWRTMAEINAFFRQCFLMGLRPRVPPLSFQSLKKLYTVSMDMRIPITRAVIRAARLGIFSTSRWMGQ